MKCPDCPGELSPPKETRCGSTTRCTYVNHLKDYEKTLRCKTCKGTGSVKERKKRRRG